MLESARSGHRPFLGHVPHNENRGAGGLSKIEQAQGGLAHLAHGAGRRGEGVHADCLDGVDDDQAGTQARGLGESAIDVGVGVDEQGLAVQPKALRAHVYLGRRLFGGEVEAGVRGSGQARRNVEHQGGLADAGIAAQKHQRTGHESAAEHAVQLGDTGGAALAGLAVKLGQLNGGRGGCAGAARRGVARLDDAVPFAAGFTTAGPLPVVRATGLAKVGSAALGHA